ncbi:MAG: putative sulfate/molybdate transporter [Euryarchaeota archaeon]|nr:putative sulfate/molybdate transporter [Euryarchaeota archaeon]
MSIAADVKKQISGFRYDRHEIAGSLGDMGTFIPFFIGIVVFCGVSPVGIMLMFGAFHIITGITFAIPMAVQPMKAIGAIAIAEKFTPEQIAAAGLVTGMAILMIVLLGGIEFLDRYVPRPVIRGVQLGLGISLAMNGLGYIYGNGTPWIGYDSVAVGIIAIILVFFLANSRKIPAGLAIFGLGIGLAMISAPSLLSKLSVGFHMPTPIIPGVNDFTAGFKAAIAQVPLTIGNSIIATVAIARDLFPSKPVNTRTVATSVGFLNILSPFIGGIPMCHGAGGISGQYRFGARTGGSMVVLGVVMMVLGLFFGNSIIAFIRAMPMSIIGAILLFAGLELCLYIRDMREYVNMFVVVFIAVLSIVTNIAIGFFAGLAVALAIKHKIIKYIEPQNMQ